MHRGVRIAESGRCPQCGGRMTSYTNGQGRGWKLCIDCGPQIPTESGYREIKKEAGGGFGQCQR